MVRPIAYTELAKSDQNGLPEPFHSRLGPYIGHAVSDHFGLTRFGVSVETLPPGSQSALRHWHSESDEFVWVVAGELTLITDAGESLLSPGMCVGFKGGEPDAHHLVNRSDSPASFLVVGSRTAGDNVAYPDDDFMWLQQPDGRYVPAKADGTPYE